MSSTVTRTEVEKLQKSQQNPQTNKKKTIKRTSSLARIRRFNSFICSQQFYVLSAILNWLKSSGEPERSVASLAISVKFVSSKLAFMKIAVYLIAVTLAAQLAFCLLFLTRSSIPGGLIFLVCCWVYINYLHYRTTFFYVAKTSMKKVN